MAFMSPSNLTVEVWPVTDAGQAPENEDFVLVHQPQDDDDLRLSGRLYIVADGEGGGTRGQIASRYAAQKVMHEYYTDNEPDLGLRLRRAIERANGDLYKYAQEQPELVRLGTTLVAAVVRGEQLHVASVGDSRAYLIRDGQIHQITRDHTLVQQLVDEGAISPEEAHEHPRRDVVLRAIGSQPEISVDVFDARLRADDALLLCTDGLTRYIHEDEITRIVATSSPRHAAESLVQKAVDRGGKDNVSAVAALLRAGGPPLETNLPHTWDGTAPSFAAMPTLAVRGDSAPSDETVRAEPLREDETDATAEPPTGLGDTVPAPRFDAGDTVPAPPYGLPADAPRGDRPEPPEAWETRGPAAPEDESVTPPPPTGYNVDPVTGLPPVPHQSGQPRQPYQPRIYQPPAQPATTRAQTQRGVSVGLFAAVGLIALLLTALMVVLLVNPLGWNLPVGGRATEEVPVVAQTEEPTDAPAATEEEAETEEAEPTEEAAAEEPAGEASPTVEPAPPGMTLIESADGTFTRGVPDDEAQVAQDLCVEETAGAGACLLEYFTDSPVESITVSPFYLDQTEVTNEAYAECVAAGVCTPPQNTEFYDDPAFANHPVVYVNHTQATQFCSWRGGRLPTEAEWEKAARWDPETGQSYIWPWGNEWEAGRANTQTAGLGGLAAVGSFARDRSPYGLLDMAGNATEWVQDWYYPDYDTLSNLNPVRSGNQALDEPLRVARGGNFQAIAAFSRGGHRYDINDTSAEAWLGFRCAQDTNVPRPEAETPPAEDATSGEGEGAPTDGTTTTPDAATTPGADETDTTPAAGDPTPTP